MCPACCLIIKKQNHIFKICFLTASRLWLISAPSILVCLSVSVTSAARSLPARSMKDILDEREREYFYLTTHSTHFIYSYMASDIWLRTILTERKETRCCHIGYSFRLTASVLSYAPSHRQDSTYHSLCYTSCGALAGTRNSSMGSPHEGSIL